MAIQQPASQARAALGARGFPPVLDWPYALAAVALAAVIASNLVDFGAQHLRLRWLNASLESSWSHRVTTFTLALTAVIAVIGALTSPRLRREWWVLTGSLTFLCVSEASSLHASIGQLSWGKSIYAPLLLVLAACLVRIARDSDQVAILRVGLVALLVSFGIHVFAPHILEAIGWGVTSWPYQVKVGLKEGGELAGWILVLVGMWRLTLGRRFASH